MSRLLRSLSLVLAASLASALAGVRAEAASKVAVAATGDPAPGGGQFAGPGFTGAPTAAGDGWIAFRGEIVGGGTSEALVAARMTPPATRIQVATIGGPAPGAASGPTARCAGTIRQFIGRPVVNAGGDVAFVALITPRDPPPADDEAEAAQPVAAGIYLFRNGSLAPVACAGQSTPLGTLDLTSSVDPFVDPTDTIVERSPALNDAGQVAFLGAVVDEVGLPIGGAIFTVAPGGEAMPMVAIGAPFEGGEILNLGPPALNNQGLIAFHAFALTDDPNDDGTVDGIFTASGGTVTALVRDGIAPPPLAETLFEFEDAVAVNDAGDVAFLAGPLFDLEGEITVDDEGSPGVLLARGGTVTLIGWPGQTIGPDRVHAFALSGAAGGLLAPPALTANGRVVFFAALNGGSSEGMFVWDQAVGAPLPLVYTGGAEADPSPVGGVYAGARTAPAVDATGSLVFVVRIAGGATSEALVFRPAGGAATPIVVGDAAPRLGFFAGRPFGPPILNDAGDVVFRAFVARGPAAVGIFRWRDGTLTPVVRAGDPSPNEDSPPFVDFLGEPSLDPSGRVAFAASVTGFGRGIYVADAAGIRRVAGRGDPFPGGLSGTTFSNLGGSPTINAGGAVAFRGSTSYRDALTNQLIKQDGVFLADETGIRVLVYSGEPSSAGLPFLRLRDVFVTGIPSVAFRASLGSIDEETSGVFLADVLGTSTVALQRDDLGGGLQVSGFSGNPAVSPAGNLAFLVTRAQPVSPGSALLLPLGPAVLRRSGTSLVPVAERGQRSPAGGAFRNLGQPAINDAGQVAFRASFLPFSGGTGGLYVSGEAGVLPLVLQQEGTPLGGRFASFGPRLALNRAGELAFTASVSQGRARTGLFVAYPTELTPRRLAIRLSEGLRSRRRDRVRLAAEVRLGRVNDGIRMGREPISVSLGDRSGPLWSVTVPGRRLRKVGRNVLVATPGAGTELGALLRSLRLQVGRNRLRIRVVSAPMNLTNTGLRSLEAPFTLRVDVGDDSGGATFTCPVEARGVRCAPVS